MPEQPSLRSELAAATRILASHRLIGMFGHVSVLTEDPQRYLVCPGAGAPLAAEGDDPTGGSRWQSSAQRVARRLGRAGR